MANRTFVRSKIQVATVTDVSSEHPASVSLSPELMSWAQLLPYEVVHVYSITTGKRWETYILPGENGDVILNGPPAGYFTKGDKVVILAMASVSPKEIETFEHVVVYLNSDNAPEYSSTRSVGYAVDLVSAEQGVDLPLKN